MDYIQQTVQDNQNNEKEILFDIIKCYIRHLTMHYSENKDIQMNRKLKI